VTVGASTIRRLRERDGVVPTLGVECSLRLSTCPVVPSVILVVHQRVNRGAVGRVRRGKPLAVVEACRVRLAVRVEHAAVGAVDAQGVEIWPSHAIAEVVGEHDLDPTWESGTARAGRSAKFSASQRIKDQSKTILPHPPTGRRSRTRTLLAGRIACGDTSTSSPARPPELIPQPSAGRGRGLRRNPPQPAYADKP
jgi:hypothetical protein